MTDRVSTSGPPLLDLDETKEFLKVTHSLEDRTILNLIDRVVNDMEGFAWTSFRAATYKQYTGEFGDCIYIRRGPVASVTSIEYYDSANQLQTLSSDAYTVCRGVPDRIIREYGYSWPSIYDRSDAVIVTYTTNPTVPEKVKERALQAIAYLYEHRSGATMGMNELFKGVLSGVRQRHL